MKGNVMTDNQTIELQEILDKFEQECFMLRVEASETHAKDDVVRESYERIRDEFAGRIAERYMELPVDADGVPIRPGDVLEYNYGGISGKRTVTALIYDGDRSIGLDGGIWDFEFDDGINGYSDSRDVNCMMDFYECNRHVKPRTLEDVLEDFGIECDEQYHTESRKEIISKYAADIRELFEKEMI